MYIILLRQFGWFSATGPNCINYKKMQQAEMASKTRASMFCQGAGRKRRDVPGVVSVLSFTSSTHHHRPPQWPCDK